MANTISQLEAKKLTAAIAFCLRAEAGKPYFGWFDLTPDEKKSLKAVLKEVFHRDAEINMEGLGTMLEGWLNITREGVIKDRERRPFMAVANEDFANLKYSTEWRKTWYLNLKEPDDPDWDGHTKP